MQRLRTLPHEKATGDVASMISSYHVVVHLPMGQLREEHGKKRLFRPNLFDSLLLFRVLLGD